MKKKPQSEAEWLAYHVEAAYFQRPFGRKGIRPSAQFQRMSRQIIAAMKRRGWTPPKKGRK